MANCQLSTVNCQLISVKRDDYLTNLAPLSGFTQKTWKVRSYSGNCLR